MLLIVTRTTDVVRFETQMESITPRGRESFFLSLVTTFTICERFSATGKKTPDPLMFVTTTNVIL